MPQTPFSPVIFKKHIPKPYFILFKLEMHSAQAFVHFKTF